MQPDFDFDLNRRKKDMAAAIVVYYAKRISLILRGFNPNQPRYDHGRWTDGGGFGGSGHKPLGGVQLAQGRGVPPRIQMQPIQGEIATHESIAYQVEARLYHQARERIQNSIRERSGCGTIEDVFLPRGQELGINLGGAQKR